LGRRTDARRGIVLTGGLAGALALALVLASHSRADTNLGTVEGQTYISDRVSSVPAGLGATVIADCPPKTHVIGGGLYQSLGSQYNILTGIYPADDSDADVTPDDRFAAQIYSFTDSGNQHEAHAICAGGPSPAYRTQDGGVAGEDSSAVRAAFCPDSMHVSSGGVRVFGRSEAPGEVNSSFPIDGPDADSITDDGWRARVVNISGPREVAFRVFAICRDSMPMYRVESEPMAPGRRFGAIMWCESYGFGPVMGGGVRWTGGDASRQHLTSDRPFGPPGGPPSQGWGVNVANAPSAPAATLTKYAVCKP
jgi:hypothetical protein